MSRSFGVASNGDRDASTTPRIYSHTLPAAEAQAAATIENMLSPE
jgi:hypothetical protein